MVEGYQFPHENYLKDHGNCPVCGEVYKMTCRCRLGNKTCANGHGWHTCGVHNKVFVGDSHKLGVLRAWSECVCPLSEKEKVLTRRKMTSRIARNVLAELSGSEALFGFCGWLTTRDDPTVMSAHDEAGHIADLIGDFCKTNELKEPREHWDDELKHPNEEIKEGNCNSPLEAEPPQSFQIKSGRLTSGQCESPQFKSLQIRSSLSQINILQESEKEQTLKMSSYPKHPDSIVIPCGELLAGKAPITELDIWNYYDGIKSKMLPELKGKDLFVGIKLEGQKGKPLYIRHPFDKKTEFIRINNEKDFMKTVTGRTVEIHQTMNATCSQWIIDFDGIPGDNFEKTKKITGEVADELNKTPGIKKVEIRYSGKRGFHILGNLKKSQPIDNAREDLKEWLKENFGDHKDVVLAETAQGKKGALGISPMKIHAGQVALWSMRVTGLCCVEVPQAKLAGFKKEDARPEKVYKQLTGKTLVPAKNKEAAQRVIRAFLKIAGYDREKVKPGYKGKFVIHNHLADKAGQHWDLRLEFPVTSVHKALGDYEGKRLPGRREPEGPYPDKPGSVFRSFAVRKHRLPAGDTKMFIVETEDHPIAYGSFHGKIPEGYGKGKVEIFDHGTYEILDVEGDKKYTLEFKGKKVHGTYALIKFQKGYLWVKAKEKKASAIDYVRPTMHPGIWDLRKDPPLILEKVHEAILKTLLGSLEDGGFGKPFDCIKSIYVSGSATSYNYKEDGDLDIDVIYDPGKLREIYVGLKDFSDKEVHDKLQSALDKNRNKKVIGTDLTYSFFILDPGDFPKSDGIYDLKENKWIHGPIKIPETFDPDRVFQKEKNFAINIMNEIYFTISEIKIALKDLKRVDQYIKIYDRLQPQRLITISRLKTLCLYLAKIRTDIWKLHEGSLIDEPIFSAFDYSRDWDIRYILFKYIARYGGHEPVQFLYSMLEDDDVKLIEKFMPDDAVGRFFK